MADDAGGPGGESGTPPAGWRATAACAAIALGLSALLWIVLGDVDLGMGDEGFLWYGVQRTAAGDVPLRDFQSYEPGRYLWCAAWTWLLGDGILALRVSILAFGAVGLHFGLLAARRFAPHPAQLLLVGAVLALWMFPRHKNFEPSMTMIGVWAALCLAERPTPRRHALVGALVGLSSFLGRNHALYLTLGVGLLVVLLAISDRREGARSIARRLAAFAVGGLVGALPMLVMLAAVPGFAESFWDSVRFFAERGSNVPRPVPWPWRYDYARLGPWQSAAAASVGTSFLLLPLVYGLGLLAAVRTLRRAPGPAAPLVAATCLGVFYAHHASVRSDALHLAQCIHPMLLGAFALPAAFGFAARRAARWTLWIGLATVSTLAVWVSNPLMAHLQPGEFARPLVEQDVRGDLLRLPPRKAGDVARVAKVLGERVAPGESVFIAPNRPVFYPILRRLSPTWRIYFLWQATLEEQQELIRDLNTVGVNWALIIDVPVDRRRDLLFRNSHPLVWQMLERNFERVPDERLPEAHLLLRRRGR